MTKSVLTLMADPARLQLQDAMLAPMLDALKTAGMPVSGQEWLAPGEALDVFFEAEDAETAAHVARALFKGLPVDAIAQPVEGRRKRLLITDMDSTIITIECIDEIADFVGKKKEVAVITGRTMNGELDFKQALAERVALLAGLPEAALQTVYDERLRFMPGAKELVGTMRANGARCVLVSGGFTFFTGKVRETLGFHVDHANRLEMREGKLTGKVVPPILDKEAKLAALRQEAGVLGIKAQDVLAAGDGANDLPMLLAAGLGVAYHAKPLVQAQARHTVNYADLTALLYAQGYRREEFRE